MATKTTKPTTKLEQKAEELREVMRSIVRGNVKPEECNQYFLTIGKESNEYAQIYIRDMKSKTPQKKVFVGNILTDKSVCSYCGAKIKRYMGDK